MTAPKRKSPAVATARKRAGTASRAGRARAKTSRPDANGATPSLTEKAYTALEELIVTLQLAPGGAVSEAMLSQRLRIGRTPIREALQKLAREGLVVILPRRGIIVSEINVKRQLRLLETRREVERLVARSAARRASDTERRRMTQLAERFLRSARRNDDKAFMRVDREFNELCLAAARNEFAAGAMRLMQSLSRRFWYHHYKQAADMPETARLHADIAQAIAAGDEAAAAAATDTLLDMVDHFTRATVAGDD